MPWLPYPQNIPEPLDDYGAWTRSEPVLATGGHDIWLAYLQVWIEDDTEENPDMYAPTWHEVGRDSHTIDKVVTHWMPLPELP